MENIKDIILDFDDVIVDTRKAVREYLKETKKGFKQKSEDIYDDYVKEVTKQEDIELFKDYIGKLKIEEIPEIVKLLKELIKYEYRVTICTRTDDTIESIKAKIDVLSHLGIAEGMV